MVCPINNYYFSNKNNILKILLLTKIISQIKFLSHHHPNNLGVNFYEAILRVWEGKLISMTSIIEVV